jgi:hypothetical protein
MELSVDSQAGSQSERLTIWCRSDKDTYQMAINVHFTPINSDHSCSQTRRKQNLIELGSKFSGRAQYYEAWISIKMNIKEVTANKMRHIQQKSISDKPKIEYTLPLQKTQN